MNENKTQQKIAWIAILSIIASIATANKYLMSLSAIALITTAITIYRNKHTTHQEVTVIKLKKHIPAKILNGLGDIHYGKYYTKIKGLKNFPKDSKTIISSSNNSPTTHYWAAIVDNEIAGYIRWDEHGSPKHTTLEFEIVVKAYYYHSRQGKSISEFLIEQSLEDIKQKFEKENKTIANICVKTKIGLEYKQFYEKILRRNFQAKEHTHYQHGNKTDKILLVSKTI